MPARLSLVTLLSAGVLLAPVAHAHPLDGISLPALRAYFVLGVEHILTGYDQLLFVAGLVIATRKLRELAWTISAFTLAHSITLGRAMLSVVTPSSSAVELSIALSIAYVGYESLRAARAPRGRVWLFVARFVSLVLIVAGLGWTIERSVSEPEETASPSSVALSDVAISAREGAPVPAWVSDVCHALQALPRERRAACAGVRSGISMTDACESTLAASIAQGALRVDVERAEQCVSKMHARYQGCGWAEARTLAPIEACRTFANGLKQRGQGCSSALECEHGLYCHGAGAFDRGVCGPPRQEGARCELAADPLASYLPAARESHPECEGRCVRGRCAEKSGT